MKIFKRLLAYAKPYGRYWPSYLVLSILSVIFGIVNYALLGPLLTVLFEADTITTIPAKPEFSFTVEYFKNFFSYQLAGTIGRSGVVQGLIFVAVTIVIACFFSNVCRYLSQRILVSMKTTVMKRIRTDLFAKIATLPIGYFNNKRKGDILSSISNDVNEVQNTVASSFHVLFREPLLVIGFLAMLIYMSPRLTLVSLVALPFSAIVITRITRYLRKGSKETQALMGNLLSQYEEAISGSRIIKAFNAQKYVEKKFDETNETHRKLRRAIFNRQELASPTSEFLGISVAAIVLLYGGWLNLHGNLGLTWPEFIVYIGFYWKVLEPAKAISNAYANVQRGLVSGQRIFDILDVESDIKEIDHPVEIESFEHSIKYDNVDFSYSSEPVLKGINLEIPKGKMVAIVGPSGAGKSTMADLLPRFWDVTGGSIQVDGTDIRNYKLSDLISLMGIVTQEAILFRVGGANGCKDCQCR
ncbi:MAG: ABC transporter ATP-binding protein [Bacteroidales bacterium]